MTRVAETRAREQMLHVRFEGRSIDIPLRELGLGAGASDAAVRETVGRYLDLPSHRLDGYVVERHASGNWTVRPEAVFG